MIPNPQQSLKFSNFQDDLRQVSAQPRGLSLPNTEPRIKREGLDRPQVVHRRPFGIINTPLPPLANLSASEAAKLVIEGKSCKPSERAPPRSARPVSQKEPLISYTSVQKSYYPVELISQRSEGDHRESRFCGRYHCQPG